MLLGCRLVAALAACLLFAWSASAQQQTTSPATAFQYGAGPVTSFAGSPTDWITITASGTKKLSVTTIDICGHIGSGGTPVTVPISLIMRSTTDTGGTSTPQTAGNLSGSAVTPTATVAMFTNNPTLGTAVATINVKPLLAGPPGGDGCVFFQYGPASSTGPLIVLPGRQLAVNLQGQTLPAGFSATSTIGTTEQ